MQHLYSCPCGSRLSPMVICISSPGKVLRVCRIEPHAPLLVRAPVNSFEFQPCDVLPRRDAYRVNFGTAGIDTRHTKHSSFRARTTGVSNPVCSPGFRSSVSVTVQNAAFATGVPPDIYAFHRYTWNSAFLSCTQAIQFQTQFPS